MNAKGFAQLLVLWALLLLGTLAMSFAFSMRTEAQASRNGMDAVRAYFQARTGIERAMALLSTASPDNVSRVPLKGEDGDAGYEVRIEPESGKIDINAVSEEMLKEILRNGGLASDEAEKLGDAILDWRDGDDAPRDAGAETSYYAALPEPIKPRDGRLASVEELRYVRGVTPELYTRLLSKIFTVFAGAMRIDVNVAPAEVLRVLPGFPADAAARVVSRREEARFRSPVELSQFLGGEGFQAGPVPFLSTTSFSRVYTVTSTGRAGGQVVRSVRCVIDMRSGSAVGGKIVRWADQVPLDEEAR